MRAITVLVASYLTLGGGTVRGKAGDEWRPFEVRR